MMKVAFQYPLPDRSACHHSMVLVITAANWLSVSSTGSISLPRMARERRKGKNDLSVSSTGSISLPQLVM